MSHCFSKQGFPCTQRAHNWPPLLLAAALSSSRLAQAPSDVAHGYRKLKIKQRAVVTAHTEPSATHCSAGIKTQRAAMGNGQCSSITTGGRPSHLHPGQNRLCPPLISVQNLVSNYRNISAAGINMSLEVLLRQRLLLRNPFALVQPLQQLKEDKC